MRPNATLLTKLGLGSSIVAVLVVLTFVSQAYAADGINDTINFQGKVVNANGTNVADGTYDFVIKVYNGAGNAATTQFTESWTAAALFSSTMSTAPSTSDDTLVYSSNVNESTLKVGQILWNTTKVESVIITSVDTGTNTLGISRPFQNWVISDTITNKVYVKDGVFRVAINSLNQSWDQVSFNTDSLHVGVTFSSDTEMKPRIPFRSTAYAQNAKKVNGLTVTNTSNNPFSSATALKINDGSTITFGGSFTTSGSNALTLTTTGVTGATLPTGTYTLVGEDTTQTLTNKTVGSTGLTFSGATTDITTVSNQDLVINPNGTGRIGFGTTNPFGFLDIISRLGTVPAATISATSSFAALVVDNAGLGDIFTASSSGLSRFTVKQDGRLQLASSLYNASCTALETDANGFVTCGTDATGGGGSGSNWVLNSTNGTISPINNTLDLLIGGIATSSAKVVLGGTTNANSFFNSGGNVGIGTSAPLYKLHLEGNANQKALSVINADGNQDLFTASVSGATKFLVDKTGNVGIGTTTVPLGKLDIKDGTSLAVLGSEKISAAANQDFSSDTGSWTTTGTPPWKINIASSGRAAKDAPGTGYITLANGALDSAPVSGNVYQVTFDFTTTSSSSGSLTPRFGGVVGTAVGQGASMSVTSQVQIIRSNATTAIRFTPTSDWYGTIDNVSVKQVTTSSVSLRLESSDGALTPLEVRAGGSNLRNLFIGQSAGSTNVSGTSNTALGALSLASNTTGSLNTATGYQALTANTTGSGNTAYGYRALFSNTTASDNTAIGYLALTSNTTGISNTAIGRSALTSNTTGGNNTATGMSALGSNTTGGSNTATGFQVLFSNTTGNSNTASGYYALSENSTGSLNTAMGTYALGSNTTGGNNTASGYEALGSNTTGGNNTASGYYALYANTTGSYNAAIGNDALDSNTTGSFNTAIGYDADLGYAPSSAPSRAVAAGGSVDVGAHLYKVSFVLDGKETQLNTTGGSATTTGGNQTVNLTAIPTHTGGFTATRKIYRTKLGNTADYYLLTTISDNTTTTYSDTTADASLGAIHTGPSYTGIFGYNALAIGSNQLVMGGSGTNEGFSEAFIGKGIVAAAPGTFALNATSGSGSNISGASLSLNGGRGTGTGAGGALIFNTSAIGTTGTTLNALSERMRIDSNGNVGIGITTPVAKLHIDGGNSPVASISARSAFAGLVIDNSGTGDVFSASTSGQTRFTIQRDGRIALNSNNYASCTALETNAAGLITCGTDDTSVGGGGGSNWVLNAATGVLSPINNTLDLLIGGVASSSAKVVLGGSNNSNSYFNSGGNVGIGTTSPLGKLNIVGATTLTQGQALVQINQTSTADIFTASASGTTRFVINNGGNVGIGTIAPSSALEIARSTDDTMGIRIMNPNTGTFAGSQLRLGEADSGFKYANLTYTGTNYDTAGLLKPSQLFINSLNGATNGIAIVSQATGAPIVFGTGGASASNERMRIDGDGNVGIGTTTPLGKLQIVGATTTAQGQSLVQINQTGTADIFTASASGTTRFIIKNDGNVGIGIANPVAKLDIKALSTASTLGAEMITSASDRDFSASTGNWTGTNWSVTGGVGNHTPAGANAFTLTNSALTAAPASGNIYQVQFDVTTTTAGTITPSFGGHIGGGLGQVVGTITNQVQIFVPTGTAALSFTPNASWVGSIDNVSVKQITTSVPVFRAEASDSSTKGVELRMGGSSLDSMFMGNRSGFSNQSGTNSTAFGHETLRANTTGGSNTAVGYIALVNSTTGSFNTAVGSSSLGSNTSGSNNTSLGYVALLQNKVGSNNTALGSGALSASTNGSNNIALGYQAGNNLTTGSNNLTLGYDIDAVSATGSNQLNIGNIIFGTDINGTGTTLSTGNVGIGTTTPLGKLQIVGATTTTQGQSLVQINQTGTADLFTASASGATRFVIANNGNVGIGVANPGATLDVLGNMTMSNTNANNFSFGLAVRKRGATGNADAAVASGAELGYHDFYGWDGDSYAKVASAFVETTQAFADLSYGSRYSLWTTQNGTATPLQRMMLDHNGNVGIGTDTTPDAFLEVESQANGNMFRVNDDGDGDTTPFIIDSGGNVGVGTTAPVGKFHVDGAVTGKALAILNETGNQNILTASSSGVTKFNLKNLNNNFGAIAETGAFISHNSYLGEEFNNDILAAVTADNSAVGDNGAWWADTTSTTCSISQTVNNLNGFARLANTAAQGCMLGYGNTVLTANKIFAGSNLPVIQMKFRANSTDATNDVLVGLVDIAAAPTVNDDRAANGVYFWSNNAATGWQPGVSVGGTDATGSLASCGGTRSTTQFAIIRIEYLTTTSARFLADSDVSDGVQLRDCGTITSGLPAAATTLAPAAYLIQTAANPDVTLDVDYIRVWQDDSADASMSAVSSTEPVQIDTLGDATHQDGRKALIDLMTLEGGEGPAYTDVTNTGAVIAGLEIVTPRIVADEVLLNTIRPSTGNDVALQLGADGSLIVKNDADLETVKIDSQGNAFFAGTLTADTIRANKIEGLEFSIRDQILGSRELQDLFRSTPLKNEPEAVLSASDSADTLLGQLLSETDALLNSDDSSSSAVVADIRVTNGGIIEGVLNVIGSLTTRDLFTTGLAQFFGQVVFKDAVLFEKAPTFTTDTAGYVTVKKGSNKVSVTYEVAYEVVPVVQAVLVSQTLDEELFEKKVASRECVEDEGIEACQDKVDQEVLALNTNYVITKKTEKGFVILLQKTATRDITFSWSALSVKKREENTAKDSELERKTQSFLENLLSINLGDSQ